RRCELDGIERDDHGQHGQRVDGYVHGSHCGFRAADERDHHDDFPSRFHEVWIGHGNAERSHDPDASRATLQHLRVRVREQYTKLGSGDADRAVGDIVESSGFFLNWSNWRLPPACQTGTHWRREIGGRSRGASITRPPFFVSFCQRSQEFSTEVKPSNDPQSKSVWPDLDSLNESPGGEPARRNQWDPGHKTQRTLSRSYNPTRYNLIEQEESIDNACQSSQSCCSRSSHATFAIGPAVV